MTKHQLIPFLGLCASIILAQEKDSISLPEPEEVKKPVVIINPKGKFYVGAEMGMNNTSAFMGDANHQSSRATNSMQLGLLAEYYISKRWSVLAKIKYYEVGMDIQREAFSEERVSSGWFGGTYTVESPKFDINMTSKLISFPIAVKLELRLIHNFNVNFKLGSAITTEIESNYSGPMLLRKRLPSRYLTSFAGLGLNYFINNKFALYMDFEHIMGPERTFNEDRYYHIEPLNTRNIHFSLGFKYSFK